MAQLKYNDGTVYEGELYLGKPQGMGKYTWADGTFYEGDWSNGVPHGKGKKRFTNGAVQEGNWENGQFLNTAALSTNDIYKNDADKKLAEAKAHFSGKHYHHAAPLLMDLDELGNAEAQQMLGTLYAVGIGGFRRDTAKALELYNKAADKGNTDAMCDLASIYLKGTEGIPKDIAKAVEWYQKAASLGDESAVSKLKFLKANGII
jgi:TPR repeat protein